MITKEQLKKVFELQKKYSKEYPKWRAGQAFFNALHSVDPVEADSIRGTEYDPFHDSEKIKDYINKFLTNEDCTNNNTSPMD